MKAKKYFKENEMIVNRNKLQIKVVGNNKKIQRGYILKTLIKKKNKTQSSVTLLGVRKQYIYNSHIRKICQKVSA